MNTRVARTGVAMIGLMVASTACSRQPPVTALQGHVRTRPWIVPMSGNGNLVLHAIGPGAFVMGSSEDEAGHQSDEAPAHAVTLTHGFWISATEVTIGQWRDVMGTTLREHVAAILRDDRLHDFAGRRATVREYMGMDRDADPETYLASEDDTVPMYFVSWADAVAFCDRLTQREHDAGRLLPGHRFSLPTEAQWEFACRAGTETPTYSGGCDAVTEIAWFNGNSADGYTGRPLPRAQAGPRAVGTKQPNNYGLHDMAGNLWEWCLDWSGPYGGSPRVDPAGPDGGVLRVNRGGSWGSGAHDQRSACRAGNPPAEASAYRGFRVVLLPPAPPRSR